MLIDSDKEIINIDIDKSYFCDKKCEEGCENCKLYIDIGDKIIQLNKNMLLERR